VTATLPSPASPPPPRDDAWRGVAAEHQDDIPGGIATLLRARSRRLIGSLVAGRRPLLAVSVLLVIVEDLAQVASPYLVDIGISHGIPAARRGDDLPLVMIGLGVAAAAVLGALSRRGFLRVTGRVGQDIILELRRRIFDHFQRLSVSFHEHYTSGRVISRQTSDIDAISEVFNQGLDGLVTAVLSIVTIGVVLLVLNLRLGAVVLIGFAVVAWLTIWFRRHSTIAYRRTREAVAMVIVHFVESLGGIRAVQAFRREPRNQSIFNDVDDRYRGANQRAFQLMAIYIPGIKLLGNLATGVVIFYGGYLALHGEITVGVLAAFLLYIRQFYEPMQDISQFYNSFQSASAAVEKLSGVLDEEPSVKPPAQPIPLPSAEAAPMGHLVVRQVSFAYRETKVLRQIDLDIPAGQTVALVGETGAGKTTLARLMARFYDPTEGQILLDGVPLDQLDEESLRRAIVMVTQENFLFTGTVAENIALGRPGATREEVERAAAAIGANRFIEALPRGYDTPVEKRGGRLSAGQRQLVSFARAFLADPVVLILDEATSSLDVPSERLVQRALRTILSERTALIIAHRLTTVEIADRVLVMDAGEIVEDGTPEDLMGRQSRYGSLHEAWLASLA
jgi:ATP-binding cassette subfamily B protein